MKHSPRNAGGRKTHLLVTACMFFATAGAAAQGLTKEPEPFAQNCSSCHGAGGRGGERGPALVNNRALRSRTADQIRTLIRNGTPNGMPGFALAEPTLGALAGWVRALNVSAFDLKPEGDAAAGERFYFESGRCATCHMVRGRGQTNGPDLSNIGRELTLPELEASLDDPASRVGVHSSATCPSWSWCPQDPWSVVDVRMTNGALMRGFARNRGMHDLQLQTLDGRFHLLNEPEYREISRVAGSLMPPLEASALERRDLIAYLSRLDGVHPGPLAATNQAIGAEEMQAILKPAAGDWPTYNGTVLGNRHSGLNQINRNNVARLQLQWTYSLPYGLLEMTPVLHEGILYVTGPNQVCALDARAGREIWCYTQPRNSAGTIAGDAAKGATRGAAVLGSRVFFTTDNAHLICLNAVTGALMWDVNMPDGPWHYGATAAPLVVNDLVIAGISGGDAPLRGFVAAFRATTGQPVWRFWTVPKRGEPASETWLGTALETGGGATWLTGSYDPESGLLFWPTGNPFPDTDGSQRGGDNLYTNCVLALDAKTGRLRWHYQFTPHDLHDWDATEPLVLVDATFQGRPRKLLLQANRNGFFYVLDRTNGELLLAKPFVKRLTWASGVGKDGRPQELQGSRPTTGGTLACPAVRGATNWYSTAFHPETKLFYVMAVEDCSIYRQSKLGGYVPLLDPANPPKKFLRAIDIGTGDISWEVPQIGAPEANYSGVLSTAGGLVFYGETGGGFAAVDAATGRSLWHFETGQEWKASPMTYVVNERQYVAVASGGNVLSFALAER